jgi:hypothetical protein
MSITKLQEFSNWFLRLLPDESLNGIDQNHTFYSESLKITNESQGVEIAAELKVVLSTLFANGSTIAYSPKGDIEAQVYGKKRIKFVVRTLCGQNKTSRGASFLAYTITLDSYLPETEQKDKSLNNLKFLIRFGCIAVMVAISLMFLIPTGKRFEDNSFLVMFLLVVGVLVGMYLSIWVENMVRNRMGQKDARANLLLEKKNQEDHVKKSVLAMLEGYKNTPRETQAVNLS